MADCAYTKALHQRLMALPKEQLIGMLEDAAKNWLAHDGLWFQAVEAKCGLEMTIQLDARGWEQFTVVEARRIMERQGIAPGGGLAALEQALSHRLYAYLNVQEAVRTGERTLIFRMVECRVQAARRRKGLPDFPCRPVGLVEYANFARAIDPRIRTRCLACPPGEHPAGFWCAWEFTMGDDADGAARGGS